MKKNLINVIKILITILIVKLKKMDYLLALNKEYMTG